MAGFKKFYQKIIAPRFSGASVSSNIVRVNTVAGLQAAVTAQKAKQIIEIEPGDYTLTVDLDVPVAANGGVLRGLGMVTIAGAAGEDSAILINPAVGSSTFEYTIENIDGIEGGANKDSILVKNETIGKKIILYLKNVSIYENGTGEGLKIVSGGGGNAIRVYATGQRTRWPGRAHITCADAGDKFFFDGIDLEGGLDGSVTDIAANYKFTDCLLKHAGITGGHATNVVNVVNCFTIEATAVAVADGNDFPGAFSPTII